MADLMVYKLYGSVTTSTDAAATLDIAFDGSIQGIMLDLTVTGADALNDGGACEVSFASTSGFSTNDTRASIAGVRTAQGFLTSGGGPTSKTNVIDFGSDGVPVSAGERMYLHFLVVGTATLTAGAWLYVRVHGMGRADRRRV